jgi:hypothetical protein
LSEVFTIDDADGIPEGELPPPMQVWWGMFEGEPLGLVTAVHGPVPAAADAVVVSHLGRVGALFDCLVQDGIASLADVDVRQDLQFLSDELEPLVWGEDTLRVDGELVPIATLAHRGLEFAAGADFISCPFMLIRLSGGSPPWPPLRSVPAPEYVR